MTMLPADTQGPVLASIPHPKVSVCIPAYQGAAYLRRVIDSILAQTYRDFELVVVDNNSSDGTQAILAEISDERLRVIRNDTTLSAVDNWNRAVRACRGEFVKLVCVDDVLKPDCVATQVAVLDSLPGVALVAVRCDFIDDDDELILSGRGLSGIEGRVGAGDVVRHIVRSGGNPIGAPLAGMFRRADFVRVGGFCPDLPLVGDIDLWVRLLGCGDFYGVPEAHASFRVRSGSMSGTTGARAQLTQTAQFARALNGDPRWGVSRVDLLCGRARTHEHVVRRTALFRTAAWRLARRRSRSVGVAVVPQDFSAVPPATTVTTVTTVICAYTTQRWEDLCRAVDSALAQDVPELDVIVVIDHCPQLYRMTCERFASQDRVLVLESDGKRGLSGARNTGVSAARGDVVAFLDDDAVAESGWARSLMRHYRDGRVAAVGGHAAPVWPRGGRPWWLPAEFDWVVGCSYVGQPTTLSQVRNPIGCNMSIRRSVFDQIGGFRSEVGRVGAHPVGGEETELCIRIGTNDPSARILMDPDARVRHRVTADRVDPGYFRRRCYHEGMSKAIVTEIAGAAKPLSAERAYTTSVLPRGVLREMSSLSGEGVARAVVIVFGLAATTAGYARAKASRILQGRAT